MQHNLLKVPAAEGNPKALLVGLGMVPTNGGMPKTIEAFRRALDARVVSFTDGAQLAQEGTAVKGAEHVATGSSPLGRFYSWAPRASRIRADELAQTADFISCHTLFRFHVNWMRHWVDLRRLPYWVVSHGCLDPYVFSDRAWQKRLWLSLVGRRHLREAHAVIFSTRNEMKKAAPFLSRDNGRVVYWPVALSDDQRWLGPAKLLRRELGVSESDRLLLSLGRLHPMKRTLETVQAFVCAAQPDLHLVIAGPEYGVTRADLVRAAQGNSRVHVIGPVWGDRKEALLFASDGFISLSLRENFGHAAAEAMGARLPVILSPGNDLTGELVGKAAGWMLNSDTMECAVIAITEFSQASRAHLRSLGDNGREWVARELSFETFRGKLAALARETVGRG